MYWSNPQQTHSLLSKRKNTVPQWSFKLNSALDGRRNLAFKRQYAKG